MYGTGGQTPPRGGERAGFSHVRAEQFANDFDSTPPSDPEPVRPMPVWMGDELRKLRHFAIARRWASPHLRRGPNPNQPSSDTPLYPVPSKPL